MVLGSGGDGGFDSLSSHMEEETTEQGIRYWLVEYDIKSGKQTSRFYRELKRLRRYGVNFIRSTKSVVICPDYSDALRVMSVITKHAGRARLHTVTQFRSEGYPEIVFSTRSNQTTLDQFGKLEPSEA